MLRPSVTVVQSQHNEDGSERRLSLPSNLMMHGVSNQNGSRMAPQQQQPGYHFVGAPQAQSMQQQQYATTQVRSVVSSMDLISASSLPGQFNGTFSPPPQQKKNFFKSSSHHTSHTAAAGDLLSMSRRALEPPSSHQNSLGGKKRSSTISEDPGNDANMYGTNFVGQHQNNNGAHHDVSATPTETSLFYNYAFNSSATTKLCNNVSSSTFASQGGADESYQQHRTIRRCLRADNSEMMEDD